MGYPHQASFTCPISFEKASERMGPGSSNHPNKLTRPGPITTPTKTSTKKPAPAGDGLIHYMAAVPIISYLFISSIMASAP